MNVIALNGSPHPKGNTYHALKMVTDQLETHNITVEILDVGSHAVRGCIACGGCIRNKDEKCVIQDDIVNNYIQKMKHADGILLGSPVHYSGIGGTMKSFSDRAFYVGSVNGGLFRHKVAAGVVAVRRSGGLPAFEQLNHYITIGEMLMPTSNYWNVIHGRAPGEVTQDSEGAQIMQVLGDNMAWLMKLVEYGKDAIPKPEQAKKIFTNFIR